MTQEQLDKFINIRNASSYSSNFQFQGDLEEAGLALDDLGEPTYDSQTGLFSWDTPLGTLREDFTGQLSLS